MKGDVCVEGGEWLLLPSINVAAIESTEYPPALTTVDAGVEFAEEAMQVFESKMSSCVAVMGVLSILVTVARGSAACRRRLVELNVFTQMGAVVDLHGKNMRVVAMAAEVLALVIGRDVAARAVDVADARYILRMGELCGGRQAAFNILFSAQEMKKLNLHDADLKHRCEQVMLVAVWVYMSLDSTSGYWELSPLPLDSWSRIVWSGRAFEIMRVPRGEGAPTFRPAV